jgi:hypothetical protein
MENEWRNWVEFVNYRQKKWCLINEKKAVAILTDDLEGNLINQMDDPG